MFSPSPFVCSLQVLCLNRRTHILHPSVLQGHILPSRGPRHPRPAPLVVQVLVSQLVIYWSEGLGVLVYAHLFLMSWLVEFYLYLLSLLWFPPALLSPYLPSSLSYHLASSFRPHHDMDFVEALDLDLVLFLVFYLFLLSQAETFVNAIFILLPFCSVVKTFFSFVVLCFDDTSLLCPHHFLGSCLVGSLLPCTTC